MTTLKCKMCGGDLNLIPGSTVCECDFCGSKQTVPLLDDEHKANLYDRANHFRRSNEYDKAANLYEKILEEDKTDAEAYWSLVLCRYGIEYVEDPVSHKRVPTVNRAQFTSIFDDNNYRSAIQYADEEQRKIYESEATAINEIQKGILAISQKEKPFDIFICYKETDSNGRRTPDSVLATDLYHQLTNEGFKVFFSRITLEDKLGTAYEPYIFAALNSAKVMVVLGTKPEYFNAVWVKNEWSRYLNLVKESNGKKTLIPAYRDMDPYDLPEEFSHLQALDMSKLGFMQDLIRGIKKIVRTDTPSMSNQTQSASVPNTNTAPLLKRAFMFLEDGNFQEADEYCERVLDQEPENSIAYLGKLMAELHVKKTQDLKKCVRPFDQSNNYQKAIRFGDEQLSTELKGYVSFINDRNERNRIEGIYNNAKSQMANARTEDSFKEAAQLFGSISNYQDADELMKECLTKAETCRKDTIYSSATAMMNSRDIKKYEQAIALFGSIAGWRDTDQKIADCRKAIENINAENEEKKRKSAEEAKERLKAEKIASEKRKRTIGLIASLLIIITVIGVVFVGVIQPKQKREKAMSLIETGDYEEAFALLEELGDEELLASSKYDLAVSKMEKGDYLDAYCIFYDIPNYKDSKSLMESIAVFPTEINVIEDGKTIVTINFEYDDSGIMTSAHRDNPETANDYIMNSSGEIIERKDIGGEKKNYEAQSSYVVNSDGTVTETELHIYDDGTKIKYTTIYDKYGVENDPKIKAPSGEDEYGHPIMSGVKTNYENGILASVDNSYFNSKYDFTQNKGFVNVDESTQLTNWRNIGIVTYSMWYNEENKK